MCLQIEAQLRVLHQVHAAAPQRPALVGIEPALARRRAPDGDRFDEVVVPAPITQTEPLPVANSCRAMRAMTAYASSMLRHACSMSPISPSRLISRLRCSSSVTQPMSRWLLCRSASSARLRSEMFSTAAMQNCGLPAGVAHDRGGHVRPDERAVLPVEAPLRLMALPRPSDQLAGDRSASVRDIVGMGEARRTAGPRIRRASSRTSPQSRGCSR